MTPKEVVTEFIARCDRAASGGDADPWAVLTDDVRVNLPGKTILSGEYPNKEIVQNVLVASVAERITSAKVSISSLVAQGDRVAALVVTTGKTVDGQTYNPKGEVNGVTFGVKGDQIEEIVLFPDNTMIETVIMDRRYLPPSEPAETPNG